MKRSKRRVYVVECWAEKDPTWTPYFVACTRKGCEREMRSARHAFAGNRSISFRIVRYEPGASI